MLVMLLLDNVVCLELFEICKVISKNFCVVKTSYPNNSKTLFFYPVRVRHIHSCFVSYTRLISGWLTHEEEEAMVAPILHHHHHLNLPRPNYLGSSWRTARPFAKSVKPTLLFSSNSPLMPKTTTTTTTTTMAMAMVTEMDTCDPL